MSDFKLLVNVSQLGRADLYGITTMVCTQGLFIISYFNISAGYCHMLITYMYMPTYMYYYILDLSPLFFNN